MSNEEQLNEQETQTVENAALPDASEQNEQNENSESSQVTEQNETSEENEEIKELFTAPENYDYKDVKLPENVKLDAELVEKFNPVAKKLNLSQKGANEIMNLAVELVQKRTSDFEKFARHTLDAQIAKYEQMLIEDKEIGGNKLDDVLRTANAAYEIYADNDVRELFEKQGLNKHPAIVKMFYQFGKLCVDDKFIAGSSPSAEERPADILFPSTRK